MTLFTQKGYIMTNTLPATTNTTSLSIAPTDTQAIHARANSLITASDSIATRKAKALDLKMFNQWLGLQSDLTVDAGRIVEFLTYQHSTGKKYATLARYKTHLLQHFDLDLNKPQRQAIKDLMRGIANTGGTKQKQAHALTVAELKRLLSLCDKTKNGIRNRAMLSVGFSCALRVSELCALRVGDIKRLDTNRGEVFISHSKTDQSGQGYTIALEQGDHVQPLNDVERHIKKSGLKEGDQLFNIKPLRFWRIMKELADKAGIDGVSCHSLRAGFITCAVGAGATIDKVKAISRHKSTDILLSYVREADKFNNNATKKVL
jgi:integrase